MQSTAPRTPLGYLPIAIPGLILILFFVVPFGTMIAMSFFHNLGGGAFEAVMTTENYKRLITPYFGGVLLVSFEIAAAVAILALVIAFPFTYLLVNAPRSTQVIWLIFFLSVLSLSEAIIGFAWSTLLSRTAGVTNLLVALGLMAEPRSLSPGLGAVIAGVTYLALPYAVLLLYPVLARVDPDLENASQTLGASPLRTFFTLVIPMHRSVLLTTFLMVLVFTLGSYLMPQILGRPQQWTLSVTISDQALFQSNIPLAAAFAVFLVIVTLLLAGTVHLLGRRGAVQ